MESLARLLLGGGTTGCVGSIRTCLEYLANIYRLFSADASISGQATGAMSYAFISALKKNPQQSYVQLLNSIRDELEGRYDQKPQLSCSHPLGELNLVVIVLI